MVPVKVHESCVGLYDFLQMFVPVSSPALMKKNMSSSLQLPLAPSQPPPSNHNYNLQREYQLLLMAAWYFVVWMWVI